MPSIAGIVLTIGMAVKNLPDEESAFEMWDDCIDEPADGPPERHGRERCPFPAES